MHGRRRLRPADRAEPALRRRRGAVRPRGARRTLRGRDRHGGAVSCGFRAAPVAAARVRARRARRRGCARRVRSAASWSRSGSSAGPRRRGPIAESTAVVGVAAASPVGVVRLLGWVGDLRDLVRGRRCTSWSTVRRTRYRRESSDGDRPHSAPDVYLGPGRHRRRTRRVVRRRARPRSVPPRHRRAGGGGRPRGAVPPPPEAAGAQTEEPVTATRTTRSGGRAGPDRATPAPSRRRPRRGPGRSRPGGRRVRTTRAARRGAPARRPRGHGRPGPALDHRLRTAHRAHRPARRRGDLHRRRAGLLPRRVGHGCAASPLPTSEEENRQIIERLLAPTERQLNTKHPMVQARVLDGTARLTAASRRSAIGSRPRSGATSCATSRSTTSSRATRSPAKRRRSSAASCSSQPGRRLRRAGRGEDHARRRAAGRRAGESLRALVRGDPRARGSDHRTARTTRCGHPRSTAPARSACATS